jgi:putative PIN family toxin of toxin-antitoxin system
LISGFQSLTGATGRLLRNIGSGRLRLVVSSDIRYEYIEKAQGRRVKALFARHGVGPEEYLAALSEVLDDAEVVHPQGAAPPCRDEDDRKYLHCAVAGRVDCLITLDNDLLDLGDVGGIPIIRPGQLLTLLRESGPEPDP